MKVDDANKIIAEFMGDENTEGWIELNNECGSMDTLYSWSLDALVPVWEKCKVAHFEWGNMLNGDKLVKIVSWGSEFTHNNKSLEIAACIATAKAIRKLE